MRQFLLLALMVSLPLAWLAPGAVAQDSPAASAVGLEELVGPVALYPDDLLSILLPATTYPLQIVQADRWIQENTGNKDAKPPDNWDDSVKAMINYPEVVEMMSQDLDWTSALGEAVATDQTQVMDAVQSFRRKAEGAGNLQSDDKQIVEVEDEVVKIVQADPQVIYVPQYEPTVVVVQQPVPVAPVYYPYSYPVYYYPYPPGYAFARGLFWGATVAWAFDWHGGGIHNDININVNRNTNINNTNINARATNIDRSKSQQLSQQNRGSWQSKQSPDSIRRGGSSTPSARTGQTGQRAQASTGRTSNSRPSTGASASRANTGAGSGASKTRSSPSSGNYQGANRASSSARSSTPSRSAFSGMSSGRSASAHSSRGASSRGMRSGGGRRRLK